MRHKTRLTLISQCIFISVASLSGSAFADSCSGESISQTCGLTSKIDGTYAQEGEYAVIANSTPDSSTNPSKSIFMDGPQGQPRQAGDTQSLVVNNSDLTGQYIEGSKGGTANISIENGSTVDMIEGGNTGSATNMNITVDGSTLNGEDNEVAYANSKDAPPPGDKSYMNGDAIYIDLGDSGNHTIDVTNSYLGGGITSGGTNNIMIDSSTVNGDITTGYGNDAVTITDNSHVNGDITTGAGNDTVTITDNSHITGTVNGGAGDDTLTMDESSSIDSGSPGSASIVNFETVDTVGNNSITTDSIDNDTTLNIENGSTLTVRDATGSNVDVNMSSDSNADLGTVSSDAGDKIVVDNTSLSTANKQTKIASFTVAPDNSAQSPLFSATDSSPDKAVSVAFSNGAQQVESRNGAYNYEDTLTEQQTTDNAYNVYFNSSQSELASDVQGMIAGLDAAKQAGRMITDDLANRLNQVHLQNLYGHSADGAQVWGDFLYQNGDYSDDVDYKDITQGVQGGLDWTTHLNNGDSLTGGIALGWTRSRDSSNDGGNNNFSDSVYGNYYSVYGGWQQSLHDNLWGMFVDGSFSYGDMRYSSSANNVSSGTTGMTQALDDSSDGSLYTTQARAGVNVLLPGETVLQPYATIGWDKAQENGFSDQEMTFGDSQVSEWNTGFGMRLTTKLADLNKNVQLYPWLDARYQTEFSDNTDIKAADYHNTDGHNAAMGIFGAGINTTIGKDFSLNTGVYFGTGDVDNDASVQAGISYHF